MRISESSYQRIIAIGDIHGHGAPVKRLLDRIEPGPGDLLVFIGDYVDRGPESRRVLDDLVMLKRTQSAVFLKGNHEDMMLGALGYPAVVTDFGNWLFNGGTATLASYGFDGVDIQRMMGARDGSQRAAEILNAVPKSHVEFLRGLQMYCESERFFFCHAGVDPRVPLEEGKRNEFDLLWRRDHLYAGNPVWEKTVVFGHTPVEEVMITGKHVAIDTGLYAFGTLSAVDVLSGQVFQASRQVRG
jgi:serine/threonine protein phosphatase 1